MLAEDEPPEPPPADAGDAVEPERPELQGEADAGELQDDELASQAPQPPEPPQEPPQQTSEHGDVPVLEPEAPQSALEGDRPASEEAAHAEPEAPQPAGPASPVAAEAAERSPNAPRLPPVPENPEPSKPEDSNSRRLRDPFRSISFAKSIIAPALKRALEAGSRISEEDALRLSEWMKARRILDAMDADARLHLCRRVCLEAFEAGDVVFRQGDPPDKFYIIQSGSVAITVQKMDRSAEGHGTPHKRRDPSAPPAADGGGAGPDGGVDDAPGSVQASRRSSVAGGGGDDRGPSRRGSVAHAGAAAARPHTADPHGSDSAPHEASGRPHTAEPHGGGAHGGGHSGHGQGHSGHGGHGHSAPAARRPSLAPDAPALEHRRPEPPASSAPAPSAPSVPSAPGQSQSTPPAGPTASASAAAGAQPAGTGTRIAVRIAGESFGELALMSSKPRSATVTAQERTVLIAVARADYNAVVKAAQEREQEERARFLRQFPMFRRWPEVALRQVAIFLRLCTFERGQTVVRLAERAEGVHFIREGECRVLMPAESPQSPRGGPQPPGGPGAIAGAGAGAGEGPGEAALVPAGGFVLQSPLRPAASQQRRLHEVSVMAAGEYFGDMEAAEGRPYPYALVVTSASMVTMCFSKADFVRHVAKNRESVKVMEHMDKMRAALRRKRLEALQEARQYPALASMLRPGSALRRVYSAPSAAALGSPSPHAAGPASAAAAAAPVAPSPSKRMLQGAPSAADLRELRASAGGSGATAALLLTRSVRAVSAAIRGPLNLPLGWHDRPEERAQYQRARALAAPRPATAWARGTSGPRQPSTAPSPLPPPPPPPPPWAPGGAPGAAWRPCGQPRPSGAARARGPSPAPPPASGRGARAEGSPPRPR